MGFSYLVTSPSASQRSDPCLAHERQGYKVTWVPISLWCSCFILLGWHRSQAITLLPSPTLHACKGVGSLSWPVFARKGVDKGHILCYSAFWAELPVGSAWNYTPGNTWPQDLYCHRTGQTVVESSSNQAWWELDQPPTSPVPILDNWILCSPVPLQAGTGGLCRQTTVPPSFSQMWLSCAKQTWK